VRLHEIVLQNLGASCRVIASGSALALIPPGTLPNVTMVDAPDDSIAASMATPGDLVLLMLADSPAGAEVLDSLPADSAAVLVLTVPPEKLPVGAALEALHACGSQVLDVVAVQRLSTPGVAIVAKKLSEPALPTPYLSRGVGEADHDGALRRIVGEWVLESFVRRAEIRLADAEAERSAEERSQLQQTVAARDETIGSLEMQVERLNQQLAASQSSLEMQAARLNEQLAASQSSLEIQIKRLNEQLATSQSRFAKQQQRIQTLEASRSVRIGRAIYRLRTGSHLRRWFPTPGSTDFAKGRDHS
jgi:hypothetical protein